jgi:hypothetical protein
MADKTTRSTTSKKDTTPKKATRPAAAKTTTRGKSSHALTKQQVPAPAAELAPASVARRRPIFQAGTWISIFMLAALVGLAFYLSREKEKTGAEATPTLEKAFIFTEADGAVSSIEVKPAEGDAVKIAHNAQNAWVLEMSNEEVEANQGLAEAAATQVTALSISTQIEEGKSPSIFGLDKPTYVITVEFKGGKTRTLEVGDLTPTNSGYYVRLDKGKMLVTDVSGIEALLQLRSSPPYLNTPTPTALPPTETPVPTAEAAATPTP